jgi:acetyltransferase-like isoleucine patch superfamily enzyme
MRKLLLILPLFLPQALKQALYRRLLGWKIGRNVHIGFSFIDAAHVDLGEGVFIGNFNLIQRLKRLTLMPRARINGLNTLSGWPYDDDRYASSFELGEDATIHNRHYFDVAHLIQIGAHSGIAGNGSSFWTHNGKVSPKGRELYPVAIRLGRWVKVGARSALYGCDIPDGYIIGMGSVVIKSFPPQEYHTLVAGNPATVRKHYNQKVSLLLPDTEALWKSEAAHEDPM